MNYLRLKALAVVLLHIAVLPGAQAAINFYVEDYSTDRIVITLSGTFEADTAGDQPGWLAIKRDWSNNIGTDTTWFLAPPGTVPTLEAGSQILVDGELCSGLTPENLASA
ncbi:MAG: hypothetical protein OIF38_01895, partial [Cellvibrionaceae bacterium]|nr:hypothetical protein [Cellvibrionaceae bacterium]